MKRCKVCNKLADNGNKRCQHCGSPFEYDPKVTPFSETRIILGIIIIALVGWIIYNNIPLQYPDPTECSLTSYNRYKKIANSFFKETKNILRQEVLFSSELSELRSYVNNADSIAVPPCLEPAKADLVSYLDKVYFTGVYKMWGAYQSATYSTKMAGEYWESFNANMAEVRECLPDCP